MDENKETEIETELRTEADEDVKKESENSSASDQLRAAYKKGLKRGILTVVVIAAVICAGLAVFLKVKLDKDGIIYVLSDDSEDGVGVLNDETLSKLVRLSRYIDRYYLYDIDEDAMRDGLCHALFSSLDENYTMYYDAEEYEEYQQNGAASYNGVGITITPEDDGSIYIINVTHDGPADKAGVQMGDKLITLNGTDVTGMETADVADMVSGLDLGADVNMVVYRADSDETLSLDMKVEEVDYNYVTSGVYDNGIGYIYLSTFSDASAEQFGAALSKLRDQDIKGLIIDLRYNGGGSLDALVEVANDFMPEGTILTIDYTASGSKTYSSSGDNELDVPIVLLVNGYTASASEALTGACRDNGIATIVGTQTFGKGIVQSIYNLGDGTGIKLTTAYYYTPNGDCIQGEGFTPDIVVENDSSSGTDSQLETAINVLTEQLAD